MDEPKPTATASPEVATTSTTGADASNAAEPVVARGSGVIASVPERIERSEDSMLIALPKDKAERVAAMRRDLADVQKQLSEAQQRIATELQGRADDAERIEALEAEVVELRTKIANVEGDPSTRARLEQELADERKQHLDAKEQLELQFTALRDANALVEKRGTEIAELTARHDALRAELDTAKRELDAARTKVKTVAGEIARLGQKLTEDAPSDEAFASALQAAATEPTPPVDVKPVDEKPVETKVESSPAIPVPAVKRAAPPPMPRRAVSELDAAPIIEVTEEAKPASPVRAALLLVGGVIAGAAVTFGLMRGNDSSAATVEADQAGAQVTAPTTLEEAQPNNVAAAEPRVEEPAPSAPVADTPPAAPVEPAAIAAPVTEGVIVLPPSAAGHRVYVDGKIVTPKSSRVTVTCGPHEVRIGSSGTAQKLDIACGGETAVPDERSDR